MKNKTFKYNFLLMLAHAGTDIPQGALPALLPFLISEYSLSYSKAAGLILASNLISAIIQPLFGHLGDKMNTPWFMCVGIFLSGFGMSLMGFFNSYSLLLFACVIQGIGVALFHPEGTKLSHMISPPENKGSGIGIFAVGGNIGYGGGPLLLVLFVGVFGMKGLLGFLVIGSVLAIILLMQIPKFNSFAQTVKEENKENKKQGIVKKDRYGAFSLIACLMFIRSIVGTALIAFIPLFLISTFHITNSIGSLGVTIFSIGGAFATVIGGAVSDKIGRKKVIVFCAICYAPMIIFFAMSDLFFLSLLFIFLIALLGNGAHSTIIVTGQDFMPNKIGFASGILFGLTVSIGGLFAPVIGRIGDVHGLKVAILVLSVLAFSTLILSLFIPKKT